MSWVIFQKSVQLGWKYGEIGEFEKQSSPKSSTSRNNSECTENLEFASARWDYASDGDILGFPSVPDAQNSKVIWSTQIRNDQKENEHRQWNSPSVHAMRPTILHCQGRSYSPRSGYARRGEPRRSYPRHSYPRRSYRRSYSRQSYSRRSYSPPRDYQVWGPALCWAGKRPDGIGGSYCNPPAATRSAGAHADGKVVAVVAWGAKCFCRRWRCWSCPDQTPRFKVSWLESQASV